MNADQLSKSEFWRAIILFGFNTATYKIALAQCLTQFVSQERTSVSMQELAEAFFDLYSARLQNKKPQLLLPHRQTAMERIIALHALGRLDRMEAIERVEKEAFGDVLPRFHTLNNMPLPISFYEHTASGLVLTHNVFEVFTQEQHADLIQELDAKWSLLEAAFEIKRRSATSQIVNDLRSLYVQEGYERKDVTPLRPLLHGCQNGLCFYCGAPMGNDQGCVDHLIPRQAINHDQVWNLVLAHTFCNQQKSDSMSGAHYLERLRERNEHLININHPLKEQLLKELGSTPERRRTKIDQQYTHAEIIIGHTWKGIRGYDPETDTFYKTIVRSLIK